MRVARMDGHGSDMPRGHTGAAMNVARMDGDGSDMPHGHTGAAMRVAYHMGTQGRGRA